MGEYEKFIPDASGATPPSDDAWDTEVRQIRTVEDLERSSEIADKVLEWWKSTKN